MRALLDELATAPGRPRPFGEIEDALGWPRRRIASVLGGVSHLRQTEFGGGAPHRVRVQGPGGAGGWGEWVGERAARGPTRGVATHAEGGTGGVARDVGGRPR